MPRRGLDPNRRLRPDENYDGSYRCNHNFPPAWEDIGPEYGCPDCECHPCTCVDDGLNRCTHCTLPMPHCYTPPDGCPHPEACIDVMTYWAFEAVYIGGTPSDWYNWRHSLLAAYDNPARLDVPGRLWSKLGI